MKKLYAKARYVYVVNVENEKFPAFIAGNFSYARDFVREHKVTGIITQYELGCSLSSDYVPQHWHFENGK